MPPQNKQEAPSFNPNQIQSIARAVLKLKHPAASVDDVGVQSQDGALTLSSEDVDKFPGAITVHVWLIENRPIVDIVMKEGQIQSKEFPLLND